MPAQLGAPPDAGDRPAREGGPGPLVLMVDDDPDVRTSVARGLRHWGFDVHVAATGKEAIDMADRAGVRQAVLVGALRSVRDSPTNPALSPPFVGCVCSRCTPGPLGDLSSAVPRREPGRMADYVQLQAPLLDVVKTTLEAAMVRHRTQLLRGSGCSTIYLQSQIYVTQ